MGVRVENSSLFGLCFQVFSSQISTIHGPSTFWTFPRRRYNRHNHAHAPGPHIWPSLGPGARLQVLMDKKIWPTSRKILPTFQTFCPDGGQFAQTVVHFAHFENQARKRGVLGRWWYSGQNEIPSGQNETHLGNLYEKWTNVL